MWTAASKRSSRPPAPARSATARSSSPPSNAWCASAPANWTSPPSELDLRRLHASRPRTDLLHQPLQQRPRFVADGEQVQHRLAHEALLHAVPQELQHAGVVAAGVQQADRLGMEAELLPGPGLEELLERAYAAREGEEGVGA